MGIVRVGLLDRVRQRLVLKSMQRETSSIEGNGDGEKEQLMLTVPTGNDSTLKNKEACLWDGSQEDVLDRVIHVPGLTVAVVAVVASRYTSTASHDTAM